MKQRNLFSKSSIAFRQWTRKKYAIFNSLKKVIKISVLIVGYNLVSQPLIAQVEIKTDSTKPSIDLDETVIESSRVPLLYSEIARVVNIISKDEIEHSTANGISDLLKSAANVDIRQRGINDIQSDLSIRGGSFEQTLILLNGIRLNDPQTGHHNMDLPVMFSDIEKIEILEGPASRIFGPNAYSGAINIITKDARQSFSKFEVKTGNVSGISTHISSSFGSNNLRNFLSVSKQISTGYTSNTDFNISNAYMNSKLIWNRSVLNLQAGYTKKDFGANSFYTAAFPDQYEKTKTLFASLNYKTGKKLKYTQSVYFRRHQDRFQLIRNNPDFYTNNHLTYVSGIKGNASFFSNFGKSSLGFELTSENIRSNILGDKNDTISVPGEDGWYFYKLGNRAYANLFFEHFLQIKKFSISMGVLKSFYEGINNNFSPGIDVSYRLIKGLSLYSTYNHSMRLPSYTELYYKGYMQSGNSNLIPESAKTLELGIKYIKKAFKSNISVYYRNGKNTIDWVRLTDTLFWEAQNITNLKTTGFEFNTNLKPEYLPSARFSFIKAINFNYSYNNQVKNANGYLSKYVMDFVKQKSRLSITHSVYKNIFITWNLLWQDRAGTFTEVVSGMEKEYEPFVLLDTKIFVTSSNYQIFFQINNILNKSYFDFGNITMPNRSYLLGIAINTDQMVNR